MKILDDEKIFEVLEFTILKSILKNGKELISIKETKNAYHFYFQEKMINKNKKEYITYTGFTYEKNDIIKLLWNDFNILKEEKTNINEDNNEYSEKLYIKNENKENDISANTLGENLREKSFLPDGKNTIGCYSTFIVHPDFQKLNKNHPLYDVGINLIMFGSLENKLKNIKDDEDQKWYIEEYNNVKNYDSIYYNDKENILMAYYWDGDGTLVFKMNDTIVRNTDCKKNYCWELCN